MIPLIGQLATLISFCWRVPQIYKIWTTRSADDLSAASLVLHNFSYVLWIVYALERGDSIILVSYMSSVTQNLAMLLMKWHFDRQRQPTTTKAKPT